MSSLRGLRVVGGTLALAGLAWSAARTLDRERTEVEERVGPVALERLRRTDPNRTEQTVRIVEVALERGERYLAELCVEGDSPDVDAWADRLKLLFWIPQAERVVTLTVLDAERLRAGRASPDRTCFTVANGDAPEDGRYAIEVFWVNPFPPPAVDRAHLSARIAGYRLPGGTDRLALGVLGIGILLMLAGFASAPPVEPTPARGGIGSVALGFAILAALVVSGGVFPAGSTWILVGGLVVATGEIAVGLGFAGRRGLALHRSARIGVWAAPVVGLLILAGSLGIQRLIPPTGVAPVETVISWPSGKLAFATLGLVVPIAEEIFFRGFVYGALRSRLGGAIAFGATAALFVMAHVPQQLGNWGGLGAVALAGILLTLLRHVSGALWPCIVAHVVYNGALIALSWL